MLPLTGYLFLLKIIVVSTSQHISITIYLSEYFTLSIPLYLCCKLLKTGTTLLTYQVIPQLKVNQ